MDEWELERIIQRAIREEIGRDIEDLKYKLDRIIDLLSQIEVNTRKDSW